MRCISFQLTVEFGIQWLQNKSPNLNSVLPKPSVWCSGQKKILYAFMKPHRTVLLVPMLLKLEYISAFVVAPTNSSFCSLIRDSPAGMLRAEWWQVSEWLPPWGLTARERGGRLLNAILSAQTHSTALTLFQSWRFHMLYLLKRGVLLNAQHSIFSGYWNGDFTRNPESWKS